MAMDNFLHSYGQLGKLAGGDIVSDIRTSGQNGFAIQPGSFDAATPLVLPPAIVIVTHTPEMWDGNDQGKVFAQSIKSMFETHAKSFSGIDIEYTVNPGEQQYGNDGQQFQVPMDVKRSAVQPQVGWSEVTGNIVWRLITAWIWDMVDPDTHIGLSRYNLGDGQCALPYTMSAYALSCMVLQPDQTMDWSRLIAAAYITNMWPTGSQQLGIKKDIGQAQVVERSISFSGLQLHNDYIYALGQSVMHSLQLRKGTFSEVKDPYSSDTSNPEYNANIGSESFGLAYDVSTHEASNGLGGGSPLTTGTTPDTNA